MPIDPSISLQIRPVQVDNPLEAYGRVLALKGIQQQQQMHGLELQQQQQAMERERAARDLFARTPNPTDAEIYATMGPQGAAIVKSRIDQRKGQTELDLKEIEKRGKMAERLGSIAGSITDEATFHRGIGQALGEGLLDKDSAQTLLGMPWGPETQAQIKQFSTQAMTAKDQADAAIKAAQEARAKEQAQREAELHPYKLQQEQAGAITKGLEAAAMTVPQDQASWDAWLKELPVPVRMKMPVMYSPEAAKLVERMGMTPGQRATADNAAKPVPGRDVPLPPDVEKQRLRMSEARGRAQAGAATADDAKIIAQGIMNGDQPPDLKGMYRYQVPVRAELERNGFNLTVAQRDWQAVQKHISTLNGAQQERLRQAVTFTYDSLDQIESLYKEWKQVAPVSGVRLFNKAALKAAKNLPGKAGEVATNLEAQINDLTAELGTVYKGGNSSTDESLRLAGENLKAEWNEQTFQRALGTIRNNLRIRKNSITNSQPAGMSANSPYNPAPAAGAKADPLGIR